MLMQVALLFLLIGQGSIMPRGRRGSSRHSLSYSYLKVSESSQRVPQFSYMVNLDDQPIARYNFSTGNMVPLVPWMEVEEANTIVVLEMMYTADLQWLSKFNPRTRGLHIWQVTLGCERREDGSKGGFFRYGYNGKDFISFNKETLRWVPAQPKAQKVKEEWEKNTARSDRIKFFLENNCLEWLEKCLSYQMEAVKKTDMLLFHLVEVVMIIILGAVILFLTCCWRKYKKKRHQGGCGQKTELREGEKRSLKASPDAYSDKVEGAALEISEGAHQRNNQWSTWMKRKWERCSCSWRAHRPSQKPRMEKD